MFFVCSKNYDAALVVLDGAVDHPAITLAISETCFDGTGGKCDLQHFRWVRTTNQGKNIGKFLKAETTSMFRNFCREKYAKYNVRHVSEMMICTKKLKGSTYICRSGPGEPLMLEGKQVGIGSWSIGCTGKSKPAVYTSIPKLIPWIQREIDSMKEVQITLQNDNSSFVHVRVI